MFNALKFIPHVFHHLIIIQVQFLYFHIEFLRHPPQMFCFAFSLNIVLNLTWDNFNETVENNEYTFIKFFNTGQNSQMLAPVFEDLSRDSAVAFAEVDGGVQHGLRVRFNISAYPALKLFKKQEIIADYRGVGSPQAIREWLDQQTDEFLVKVASKDEIKVDSKKRKLDIFFTLYGQAANYSQYRTEMKQNGGFWYFIDSAEPAKIVANRQGYQFTLSDLSQPQKIQRFVAQHSLPFLPFMTVKNMQELRIAGKQLAFLIRPSEDIRKLVEVNQVSPNYKELSRFQFVETTRKFVQEITHKTIVDDMLVVFFSDKNPQKIKVLAKYIANDQDLIQVCSEFDTAKMEVVEDDEEVEVKNEETLEKTDKTNKDEL